jgi:hypothetical protein
MRLFAQMHRQREQALMKLLDLLLHLGLAKN